MTKGRDSAKANRQPVIRCAIYTRKSTEEGLQQEFNTLDAQRESAEAYVKSMASEGWVCLAERYDDGGFTGGNMDRPALKRLLNDIEAGKVDCVIVYKVDRLSRSLIDFARMMEVFEKGKVSFVAVTQQINTGTSMGRLMLNVLLSFAQFERELVSERTKDKIAAARRKGKWAGGHPLLGYDAVKSPGGTKLVVNEDEAVQARQIFDLYLEHQGLIPTLTDLDTRNIVAKRWTTRKGHQRGGKRFNKYTLYTLLKNPVYLGKVTHKDQVYPGEHTAIIHPAIFERVQKLLRTNGRGGPAAAVVRNRNGALLKGLLRCKACGCSMGHTYSSKGNVRYRYYVCLNAVKRGWHTCPSKSVPAEQIERFVIDHVHAMCPDNQAAKALRSGNLPVTDQVRILQTLVDHVDYDGPNETVSISLNTDHSNPLKTSEAVA